MRPSGGYKWASVKKGLVLMEKVYLGKYSKILSTFSYKNMKSTKYSEQL